MRQVPSGENTHEVPRENTLQILGQNMTSSAQASALGNNTHILPETLIPKEIQPVTGNDGNLSKIVPTKSNINIKFDSFANILKLETGRGM